VRRVIGLALAAGAVGGIACASAGTPPGGPEDKLPPKVLTITPESGQTNVHPKEVEIRFDEVVSDRGSGPSAIDQLFLISPRTSATRVAWHRSRVTVKPARGFLPNTAYRITVLPGVADLRGNIRKDQATALFSTGSDFPPYSILGVVFDWSTQAVARGAYVEAIAHPDTNIAYVAATDTAGDFEVGPLPAGTYTLRGLIDQNGNRVPDRNEKWDTTTVTVSDARRVVELDAIERDTVPPAIANIDAPDSLTLRVTFDKPLDPAIVLQPALFRVQRADSTPLEIGRVEWASAYEHRVQAADSAKRAQAADSARRAQEDSARRARGADTARRGDTARARPAPRPSAPPAPSGVRPPPPPRKPKAPPPEKAVVLSLSPQTPMHPGETLRIRANGLRNLVGKSAPLGPRAFNVPKPAPHDSTNKPPAAPPPARRPPAHR
jgi:Big-like domain-containing protein